MPLAMRELNHVTFKMPQSVLNGTSIGEEVPMCILGYTGGRLGLRRCGNHPGKLYLVYHESRMTKGEVTFIRNGVEIHVNGLPFSVVLDRDRGEMVFNKD